MSSIKLSQSKNFIKDFTVIELEHFRKMCNFTDAESQYFEMKAKNCSNVQVAMEMNISESQVSKLAKRVKSKILRVIE